MVVNQSLGWFIIFGSGIGIAIGLLLFMAKKKISERFFPIGMALGALVAFLLYHNEKRIFEYTPEKNMEVKMAFWAKTWEVSDSLEVQLNPDNSCCIVNASDVPLVIETLQYGKINLPGSSLSFIDPNTYNSNCSMPDYLPTEFPPESVTVDDRSGLGFDLQSWVREATVPEIKGRRK